MAFLRNDFFRIVIEVIMATALNVSEIVVSHSLLSAIVLVTTGEALNSWQYDGRKIATCSEKSVWICEIFIANVTLYDWPLSLQFGDFSRTFYCILRNIKRKRHSKKEWFISSTTQLIVAGSQHLYCILPQTITSTQAWKEQVLDIKIWLT